ncbi:MAG: restriction endonuclease [Methylobacter sp.]|nr:restriction endonuclease [Methylobacter sp.]
MSGLLSVIFIFVAVISVIDAIVMGSKKKPTNKTPKKKMYKKIVDQIEIGRELKKIEEDRPIYAIPEKIKYSRRDTVDPANENCIRWNKAFLKSLEWKRYEEVCMEYLRIKSCHADVTSIGADGGIDIKVKDKNGNTLAVAQCKSWKRPIGVDLIRQIYGIMAGERIKLGIFLTTSVFSPDAIKFAEEKKLILIDADELINLINGLKDDDKKKIDRIATEGDYTTPTCVHCNVKMVKRVATKGMNEGSEFWGCVNFPKCRKTMFVKL